MSHRIGESGFFPPEDIIRQIAKTFKSMAQQVLALTILIQLHFRIDGHNVFHEVQVAKGNSGFQRVEADAAVSPENIVHMKFLDPLLCFFLESIRRGGKIRIFISEQLVRNLTGKKNADIRVFVNVLAYQIHADAGANGGNIKGTQ